jgi:hypothetical protein
MRTETFVPEAVVQVGRSAVDQSNNQQVRFRHYQTLLLIRDFCDRAIAAYNNGNKTR